MIAVEVGGVTKRFGEGKKTFWALHEINLTIPRGVIFGLLGPNGAGKSTLLHIMANILLPTSGKIKILGKNSAENPSVLEKIGFMSSESQFHWALRVNDILRFYGMLYGLRRKDREQRLQELTKELHLEGIENLPFHVLSTGQRARVALAKAFIHRPAIVVLDEPTSGLDPHIARTVRHFLKRQNEQGTTIIITSHNMQEVELLCSQVCFIHRGRIIDQGTIDHVTRRHAPGYEVLFTVDEVKERLQLQQRGFKIEGKKIKKTIESSDDLAPWLHYLHQKKIKVLNVETKRPSLEDYFVRMVQQ